MNTWLKPFFLWKSLSYMLPVSASSSSWWQDGCGISFPHSQAWQCLISSCGFLRRKGPKSQRTLKVSAEPLPPSCTNVWAAGALCCCQRAWCLAHCWRGSGTPSLTPTADTHLYVKCCMVNGRVGFAGTVTICITHHRSWRVTVCDT